MDLFVNTRRGLMHSDIGQVLDEIKSKGIEDNTLVIFTNDNGGARLAGPNGPYRGYKRHYHQKK